MAEEESYQPLAHPTQDTIHPQGNEMLCASVNMNY